MEEFNIEQAVTVSQINRYIKLKLDHDVKLNDIFVCGEVSNFSGSRTSGHLYFSLKDEAAVIKAVMFERYASKSDIIPKNGMKVILRGQVSSYERDGIYQIYVTQIFRNGTGDLSAKFEELKKRLASEGLFDECHKKKIPLYPEKIGVVTSPTGAAAQDILNVLSRRFPLARLFLYPAVVQGNSAAKTLISGIEYFDTKETVDIILLGRGGGSTEDLWCFNDEALARAIYSLKTPVISCVGHETDFTISDFVSDLRAPTPSAAAELAAPDENSVRCNLDEMCSKVEKSLSGKLMFYTSRFSDLKSRPCLSDADYCVKSSRRRLERAMLSRPLCDPGFFTEKRVNRLNELKTVLNHSTERCLEAKNRCLLSACSKLDAMSPLKVLSRGYSIVTKNGDIAGLKDISVSDEITVALDGGSIKAKVTEKKVSEKNG